MGSDPTVPNSVLMHNSLVIHSPFTYSCQSAFSGSSNIMVVRTAYLIYLYTHNELYLKKANIHFHQFLSKHHFQKGYTNLLNTETMQPYSYYNNKLALIFDLAPIVAILALQNAIIPSKNVSIDWGYGFSTSLPNDYGSPGVFRKVRIDIAQEMIHLESVTSDPGGYIYLYYDPRYSIKRIIMDNQDYTQFDK